ncbi:MAG: hypothetical protein U1F77_11460 [Kiritimatiellia bacterium]
MRRLLLTLLLALASAPPCSRAAVLMIYYDTEPLLDEDGTTPLRGTSSSGDLVQLISAGINGVVDPPDSHGGPGGDDELLELVSGLNVTHIGANEPPVNYNLGFFNAAATYDEVMIGLPVFARFWNGGQPWSSTHYGVTGVFSLPAPDEFHLAWLDLAPLPSSPRSTLTAFTGVAPAAVPEPNGLIFLGLAALLLRQQLISRR